MRAIVVICLLVGCLVVGCKGHAASAIEVTDRGWRAHELVVGAGERAATCAAAGTAMQRVFAEHQQDFVDAIKLDSDPARLAEATSYLEAHQDRYSDLETRMEALAERCSTEGTVQEVFHRMETP